MKALEFVPSGEFGRDVRVLEEFLGVLEVDFILIPDQPLGRIGASSVVAAKMLQDALRIPSVATISGAGKSAEGVRSLLLGARYAELLGVACVSGDALERESLTRSLPRAPRVHPQESLGTENRVPPCCVDSMGVSAEAEGGGDGGVDMGSGAGLDSLALLDLAWDLDFELRVCTADRLDIKAERGANLAISQPLFTPLSSAEDRDLDQEPSPSARPFGGARTPPILPSFMPIFSPTSLAQVAKRSGTLGFAIPEPYRSAGDLMEANLEILRTLEDFYLIPLDLERQMEDLKILFGRSR